LDAAPDGFGIGALPAGVENVNHAQTVQDIYAAFGRGDIPAIIATLSEDVIWEYGTLDSGVPWLQPRRGRAEVVQFFESLGGLDFRNFQPKTILASGSLVVSLIDVSFTVKATGRGITEEDEVHIWHFNEDGRVARFCHRLDSHKHWLAVQSV
jgi:ketosteroid isomerase-like protein